METKIGGKSYHFFGPGPPDFVMNEKELKGVGKRSLEWDLNDWKWDGDLFIASSLNSAPSDCQSRQLFPVEAGIPAISVLSNSSSSCSDEINLGCERGKRELEKRRREDLFENGELNNGSGSLSLKLGGNGYPIIEGEVGDGKNGKKTKLVGTSSSRAICQVEDCNADLSDAKDYHRRHKVCDMHSKATTALVANVMQRFCQQCSRFHVLQEFDDGKRSCRRRLAGHNRRRRKTNPDSIVNGSSLNDTQTTSYLLISLLRILSNMHSNSSDHAKDQDILSHLLKNLANLTSTLGGSNFSGLLQKSQDLLNVGTSVREVSEVVPTWLSNGSEPSRHIASTSKVNGGIGDKATPEMSQSGILTDSAQVGPLKALSLPKSTSTFQIKDTLPPVLEAPELTTGRMRLNNFDLNNIYNDSDDFVEGLERVQRDSHHSSPPQTSDNSDSASARSPSSSSGDGQSRTDRIVFKLFGKDPNDLPIVLRAQILNWLSSSPTDIESYIRPGCIILTVYLRLAESTWDELCCDLSSSLIRFLDVSHNKFWRTGWVYTRVQHRMAFMYNGQVVLDTLLPLKSHNHCRISSIKPIAVSVSEAAQFTVKGFNLSHPTTRLLCALEGKYLIQEATHDLVEGTNTFKEHDELQCLSFSCSIPNILGRGFIEVEEHGLSSSFFPFIVAEQNICSEIRMLEETMDITESEDKVEEQTAKIEAKNQALDFIHELGWLLHRSHSRSRLGHMDPNADGFQFTRFKSLVEFSMGHDWCALVKKLLDIFLNGIVDAGEYPSVELALSNMCLLHRAVRRNCKPMVELLLRYLPGKESYPEGYKKEEVESGGCSFLFRPDVADPTGLTPLHIAASIDGSESILDALTEDPGLVGIKAWNSTRDNTGFTPENYARLRGHFSYIHLVQRKINKKSEAKHVILDIPAVLSGGNINQKPPARSRSGKLVSNFQIEKIESKPIPQYCKLCDQQLAYGKMSTSLVYRPAMLSMVAIAAVCVCVGLLFKSSPEVLFGPFRWELLDYGTI